MDYASDDDLLVVTGGVPSSSHGNRPASGSVGGHDGGYSPTNYATAGDDTLTPQSDADFALRLQQQRAEMRLASQQATNMHGEMAASGRALRSVVPVPEGAPMSASTRSSAALTNATSAVARRGVAAAKQLDPTTANNRIAVLEEEVKGLNNQLHNQSKGLQRMTVEAEKQAKLIATLNARIDREAATNRDLQARLKLAETQSSAQKKEMQMMQREAGGLTGITADARLQKALEEIAQLKGRLATITSGTGGGGGIGGTAASITQQQVDQLVRDKKKLEAQRVELLNCIRKQNKLIEVLRRQKLHLEAAKLLQMTEEDFTRVLEAH